MAPGDYMRKVVPVTRAASADELVKTIQPSGAAARTSKPLCVAASSRSTTPIRVYEGASTLAYLGEIHAKAVRR